MNLKSVLLTAGFLLAGSVINAQNKNTMEQATFTQGQKEVMKVILDMTDATQKDLKCVLANY